LAQWVVALGHEAQHVSAIGLLEASDDVVWEPQWPNIIQLLSCGETLIELR